MRRIGSDIKYYTGNRIKTKYGIENSLSLLNNGTYFTTHGSTDKPMQVCWQYMTKAMRDIILQVDWSKASPKITDRAFMRNFSRPG